ncbi:ATP-binding cassette domain-containing protein [Actinoallomurus rhizosphaericola]|uniref:ATP-binding cassette domain-containing protein n=1 Tax=Actinoallomurus rhizosphaericola TaxID=2952536 RepID=UPI0020900981|nr:ATP-binding cassette domain-containing protein [Actinoallomurus rhizosphaericola]MCO5993996.1 ATP-binding cassette domain-containing protein [Actinoallomurus rhizosphaericola]
MNSSAIVARGLGIRRRRRWILRPTTVEVAYGVVGLAAPAGPARSAVLQTLATLRHASVGDLEVLGQDVTRRAGRRAVRARIGLLPARFAWTSGLSTRDFVAYASYYKCTPRRAVDAILERFGLSDAAALEMDMLPQDLRLRAGIAAACAHEPELVFLDEPLAGIGDSEREELIPLLRALAPAVVVTAADPAELSGWCDQGLSMVRGRLIEAPCVPRPRARVPAGV